MPLDSDRGPANQCAAAAFRAKVPFFVAYEVASKDSTIIVGFVRMPGGDVLETVYDSDPCGGARCGERFSSRLCPSPKLVDAGYPWVIECEPPEPPLPRRRPCSVCVHNALQPTGPRRFSEKGEAPRFGPRG